MEKAFDSLPRDGGAFRILRRDDRGQLKMLDVLPRDSVLNPDELLSLLQEKWGGGRYYVVPTKEGKKAGDGFGVEFDGEAKKTRKKADDNGGQKRSTKQSETDKEIAQLREELRDVKEKDRENQFFDRVREEIQKAVGKRDGSGEVVESILKSLPQIVAGLSGLLGNRESAADMLEKVSTVVKNVAGDGGMDPFQLVSGVLQLLNQHSQRQGRAPVQTTGSTSTGLEKFFEGLGQAVPALAPLLAARFNGGTSAAATALPPNTDPNEQAPAMQAFAGTEGTVSPSATVQPSSETPGLLAPINPLSALAAQIGSVQGGVMDSSFAAYGALMKLRYMIDQKDDPYSVAAEIIDSINLVMGSQRIAGRWQNFITVENVEALFDQYAPMIPEFAIDPAYTAECRAVLVEAVRDQLSPDSEEAAGEEKQTEAAEEKTLTPDERQAQETESAEGQDAAEKVKDAEPESEVAEEEAPAPP